MKNKSAIITGSTDGIGLVIAKKFAENGYNIMLNGFGKLDEIEKLRQDLTKKFGVKIHYSSADVSDPFQVKSMVEEAISKLGSIDVIVNNAGIQHIEKTEDFPVEKWNQIINVNLSGAFYLIKYSLSFMQKQNFGRIINIASVHGLVASINKSAYVAAKHGLVGLTKVVALENANFNINCNAICPGWVHTSLVQKQIEEKAKINNITINQARENLLAEKQPSMRFVEIEELASLAIFLASEETKSINGIAIPIDGGWTAR